jgi:hypothetical protein
LLPIIWSEFFHQILIHGNYRWCITSIRWIRSSWHSVCLKLEKISFFTPFSIACFQLYRYFSVKYWCLCCIFLSMTYMFLSILFSWRYIIYDNFWTWMLINYL